MSGPYHHRPITVPLPDGVPIDQLTHIAAIVANDMSRQGWEVILPPMLVASGGPLVGSEKLLNLIVWVRCPVDSPLATAPTVPPPGMTNKRGTALAEAHGTGREAVPM